jgi:predicted small lipoprotein YifL
MKRLFALMLAMIMLLSLAACSKEEYFPTSPNATAPTSTTKDPSKLAELYWRNSYTASDTDAAAAHDTVVATLGGAELTNGMLQIYYWMDVYNFLSNYGSYLSYYGLDHTKPLDQQVYMDSDGSWQHYFLASAIDSWRYYQALSLMADETQTPMDPSMQETLDNLYTDLEKRAQEGKFDSIDAMIQADAGAGCTAQDYYRYTELSYKGFSYFNKMVNKISVTDKMIEDYFAENEDSLKKSGITKDSGDVCSVRHILIQVNSKKTDDDWVNCYLTAQKLMTEWANGEATEASFAALAKKHSADGGSKSNGGLYEGLNKDTNFVTEFKNWYLDESRKSGDYGLVKTTHGYHIMYFSGTEPQWIYQCREAVTDKLTTKIISDAMDKYTLDVNYEKILLGEVDLK